MHEVFVIIVPDGAWGVVADWAAELGCCDGQGCGFGVPRRTWLWYEPFLPLVANESSGNRGSLDCKSGG